MTLFPYSGVRGRLVKMKPAGGTIVAGTDWAIRA
jgi:hypothetical protein